MPKDPVPIDRRAQCHSRIRGLYGIADAGASGGDPVRLGGAILEAGCRLIQLRCKDWPEDDVVAAGRSLVGICRAYDAWLIVNDHPDVALRIGADGVHLGQTDAPTAEVREALADLIVGRSTNGLDELDATLPGADYLAFGPMFATPHLSRPKAVQGPALLRAVRARVSVPLVAIGGITLANVADVVAAGADAWAVIGAIAQADDPEEAARAFMAPGLRASR